MGLKLVKGSTCVEDYNDSNDGILHETKVLKEIISPWFHKTKWCVLINILR